MTHEETSRAVWQLHVQPQTLVRTGFIQLGAPYTLPVRCNGCDLSRTQQTVFRRGRSEHLAAP